MSKVTKDNFFGKCSPPYLNYQEHRGPLRDMRLKNTGMDQEFIVRGGP
jgi:hypothetical protein